ncbi:hypothetical protein D3C72_1405900 [compost metagenome]
MRSSDGSMPGTRFDGAKADISEVSKKFSGTVFSVMVPSLRNGTSGQTLVESSGSNRYLPRSSGFISCT